MEIGFSHVYDHIISIENLLEAWQEFKSGKSKRKDVQEFQFRLMDNVLDLHNDLKNKTYTHGGYHAFNISDPKPRNIHKASVRDRLVHHALYRKLYPFFDKRFISDSFSCRLAKGTHRAMNRFRVFAYKVSENHTCTCWVLKSDIRKFFASVDHAILLTILEKYIPDKDILSLISNIVGSFHSTKQGVGLPLGNLTSQLLVNIYMNEFDQWMKHTMKVKHYIRYADDFVILSHDKDMLLELTPKIADFLEECLKLSLHPDKVFIKTFASGVDFLGWVHFVDHRVLRTTTKKRMIKKLKENGKPEVVRSYLGLLGWGDGQKLAQRIGDMKKEVIVI